jgi:hypothetical protein
MSENKPDLLTKLVDKHTSPILLPVDDREFLLAFGRELLLEMAKECDAEEAEYSASSRRCDASGNTFGGSLDNTAAITCCLIARRLRSLAGEGK